MLSSNHCKMFYGKTVIFKTKGLTKHVKVSLKITSLLLWFGHNKITSLHIYSFKKRFTDKSVKDKSPNSQEILKKSLKRNLLFDKHLKHLPININPI